MPKRHRGGDVLKENGSGREKGSPPHKDMEGARSNSLGGPFKSLCDARGIPTLSGPSETRLPPTPTSPAPRLSRLSPQVRSVAVTHTFQIAKARAQLGYVPDKFSFADAVERYVQSTAGRTRGSNARTLLRLLLGLLLFLGLLVLALRFLGLQPSII